MAYTVFGLSTSFNNGATALGLTKPPGLANGDLILAAVNGVSYTPTLPGNFTLVIGTNLMNVSYRVVDGSEGASFTWTAGSTQNWVGIICAIRGIDKNLNTSGGSQQPGSVTTVTFSSLISPPGGLVVAACGENSSAASITWPPAGYTSIANYTNGGDAAAALAYKADVTGNTTPGNVSVDGGVFSWRAVTGGFYKAFNRQAVM